ncbi:unnamed protein product [Ambrosiozyma monospora]|uniref:Unnamed protein product n=1 Tax=Ambrosiozyma monospora TaxID=43982 RepID=A0A9W6T6X2_AMBMO|nr:unnamed protein product [Ambrosiozyma monospora]
MLKRMFAMPELPQIVHWQTIVKQVYRYAVESDMQKMAHLDNYRPEVSSANVDRLNSVGQKFDKYFDLRSGLDAANKMGSMGSAVEVEVEMGVEVGVDVEVIFDSLRWTEKGPEWQLSRNSNEFRKAAKSLTLTQG